MTPYEFETHLAGDPAYPRRAAKKLRLKRPKHVGALVSLALTVGVFTLPYAMNGSHPSQQLPVTGAKASSVKPAQRVVAAKPSPKTTELTAAQWEQIYLATVKGQFPSETQYTTDAALLRVGHATCDGLNDGVSVLTAATLAIESGIDPGLAGGIIGSAIAAFCPEFTNDMLQFSQAFDR